MKVEDIDKLTIAEVRQIAERAGDALRKFKSVSGLLGGAPAAEEPEDFDEEPDETPAPKSKSRRPVIDEDAAAAHRRRQFQPVETNEPRSLKGKKPRTTHPGGDLTSSERAQRNRLIAGKGSVDPNLPEDMQRLEQGEPP